MTKFSIILYLIASILWCSGICEFKGAYLYPIALGAMLGFGEDTLRLNFRSNVVRLSLISLALYYGGLQLAVALVFMSGISYHSHKEFMKYRAIFRLLAYFLLCLILFQSFLDSSYDLIYQKISFIGFTKNPNMLGFVLVSIFAFYSYFSETRSFQFYSAFIIWIYLLILVDSRNVVLPVVLLALAKTRLFLTPFERLEVQLLLVVLPFVVPVLIYFGITLGLFSENIIALIQRPDWLMLLESNDKVLGLNIMTSLYSQFGLYFSACILLYLIVLVKNVYIPIEFFAVWIMGVFESHLVTYSYGIPLLLAPMIVWKKFRVA